DRFTNWLENAACERCLRPCWRLRVDLNAVKFGDPFGGRPVVRTEPSTDGGFQTNTQSSTRTQTPLAGGVFEPICETVFQTTTLPDGTQTRAPVEVCQYSEGGEWIPS
ncbi:MAG: hypothetical protein AAGJ50_05745, partial [Pseudomonadota bacterium]